MPTPSHFVERAVDLILKRFPDEIVYTCESGLTPSGKIHLGNFFDVCIADSVMRELRERGIQARHILAIDAKDPFRRAPAFAPRDFKAEASDFIGRPLVELPDPWGCHKDYVEHFVKPFLDSLEEYGIELTVKYATEIHRDPRYLNLLRGILERRREVRDILNEVRKKAGHKKVYPPGWIPYRPQCEACHRIDEAVEAVRLIDENKIAYVCRACGNEGVVDIRSGRGKPPWRIDWPLRWVLFNVHFEPLGKDLMASGSSYDTGKALIRRLYGRREPVPIFYDFVMYKWADGKVSKFSKRRGVGIGVEEWLRYAPPEVLRFMVLRREARDIEREALQHWIFDPKHIPTYVEDYDKLEREFFGAGDIPERLRARVVKIYKLSQVKGIPSRLPRRVPYFTAVTISQRARDLKEALDILHRLGVLPSDATNEEIEDAKRRIQMAGNWVRDYAPEYKFVSMTLPSEAKGLSQDQRRALLMLAEAIESGILNENNLREYVWSIATKVWGSRQKAKKVYEAVYVALSGKKYGPPLSKLIFELADKDFIVRRLRKAAGL